MEMGGAGHSDRGLLVGKPGKQVHIHNWAKRH